MAGVAYSPKALADIERIRDYIRDVLLNPEAAAKFVSDAFEACDSLAEKPRPGALFRSEREMTADTFKRAGVVATDAELEVLLSPFVRAD